MTNDLIRKSQTIESMRNYLEDTLGLPVTVIPSHRLPVSPSAGSAALDRLVSDIYARCGTPGPATSDDFNQVLSDAFIFGCGAFQYKVANGEIAVVHIKWLSGERRP